MDVNISNTVEFLHELCKANNLEFFCYVGKSETEPDKMNAYTTSKKSMVDRMVVCANEDAEMVDFFNKISAKLKTSNTIKTLQ